MKIDVHLRLEGERQLSCSPVPQELTLLLELIMKAVAIPRFLRNVKKYGSLVIIY
jgi:hypothetical protein